MAVMTNEWLRNSYIMQALKRISGLRDVSTWMKCFLERPDGDYDCVDGRKYAAESITGDVTIVKLVVKDEDPFKPWLSTLP
jgi:hypothetical protein